MPNNEVTPNVVKISMGMTINGKEVRASRLIREDRAEFVATAIYIMAGSAMSQYFAQKNPNGDLLENLRKGSRFWKESCADLINDNLQREEGKKMAEEVSKQNKDRLMRMR